MERTLIGLVLAKIEGTYGVDPTPTGGSNTIAISRNTIKYDPKFQHLMRQHADGSTSRVTGLNVLPEVSFGFQVELRGNRTNGSTADISKGALAQAIEIDVDDPARIGGDYLGIVRRVGRAEGKEKECGGREVRNEVFHEWMRFAA